MALNKKFFPKVSADAAADTFTPSEHFNTVLYTGTGAAQRIGGYINRGATGFAYNKYITFPDMGGFTSNTSDSDGALSIWINFDSIPASSSDFYALIDRGNPNSFSSSYQALELLVAGTSNTNEVEFRFRRGFGGTNYDPSSYTSARATVAVGTWYNLVVSYVASTKTATFYLNSSTAIGSYSLTSSSGGRTIDSGFNIGTYANSSSYSAYAWDGMVDQFRIFNKALSTSEVATLNGETFASTTISTTDIFSDNSAIALYQLDGNANDTGGVSGKYGAAAHFNGSNSSIRLPDNLINNVSPQNFSVAFWFNNEDLSKYAATFSPYAWESGVNYGWSLYAGYGAGKIRFISYSSNGNIDLSGATSLSANTWYHCTLTYDGANSTVKLYLNGSQDASDSTPGNRTYLSSHTYYVGAQNNGAGGVEGHFQGKIDDVRVYTDVLTATEVGYIYNNTTASIPTDNLLAHYKLNGDARDETVPSYDGAASNVTYAYDGTASNVTYQEATKFQPDLVWIKGRSFTIDHAAFDSVRGVQKYISPSTTGAEGTYSTVLTSFDSNGFTVGNNAGVNQSSQTYVAWCFNAGSGSETSGTGTGSITNVAYKANTDSGFSIVKYTGSGSNGTVTHGLSNPPTLIIVKRRTTTGGNWSVYTSTTGNTKYLKLHSSDAAKTPSQDGYGSGTFWNETDPTSSVFSLGTIGDTNSSGDDFIAYCFHDVAGYQKIGTYQGTGNSEGNFVETGFEPAFLMIKSSSNAEPWFLLDNKRDVANPRDNRLMADSSAAEDDGSVHSVDFLSNGFKLNGTLGDGTNGNGVDYIYLAIAADPDTTTPTVENSFDVVTYTGTNAAQDIEMDFKPDLLWIKHRNQSNISSPLFDTIRGSSQVIRPDGTNADTTFTSNVITSFNDNGFSLSSDAEWWVNRSGGEYVAWAWKAGDHDDNLPQINTEGSSGGSTLESIVSVNDAAGFSIVKYTGTGSDATIGHGLSNPPQIIFVKRLDTSAEWVVGETVANDFTKVLRLDTDAQSSTATYFNSTDPTSTVFSVRGASGATGGAGNFIAYCWYSVTGHSEIGTYDGNGSTTGPIVTFAGSGFEPRFLMVKRTDADARWVIWDSQRDTSNTRTKGLSPNLSSAEITGFDVDFLSNGFQLKDAESTLNASGGTYIYMAFK